METYKTFKRSATNFEEFARARKITVDTGLTYYEALRACEYFNANRTSTQKRLKLEFTKED